MLRFNLRAITVVFVFSRASVLSARMSSFVHARSFTVFPAIYVLPAANFANESVAYRKIPLPFKMTIVDNRVADARFGSVAAHRRCPRRVRYSSNRSRFGTWRHQVANRCCYRIGTRLVDALKRVECCVGQGGLGSGNSAELYNAFFVGDRQQRINYF